VEVLWEVESYHCIPASQETKHSQDGSSAGQKCPHMRCPCCPVSRDASSSASSGPIEFMESLNMEVR